MKRREFLALAGVAGITWPVLGHTEAQRLIGFLHQGSREPPAMMTAFMQGLADNGIAEKDVAIENRWADGAYDRLPALAAELVNREPAVIAANFLPAALAVKAATQSIPIVFLSGSDPIAAGLVPSLARPSGNVTGIAPMFTLLGSKNLELLRELVPTATVIGILSNQTNPNAKHQIKDLQQAALRLSLRVIVLPASNDSEIEGRFAELSKNLIHALVVTADGFLISRQDQIVSLSTQYAIPTMYPLSQYVVAGGLMSYGANLREAFHATGAYVGRILKGAKPDDLPVQQPTTVEFVINVKAAKALGLAVPPSLLALADEVIE